jgi:hypothetical protein
MSHTLTVELSDTAYAALSGEAQAAGTSPSDLAAVALEQQFGCPRDPRDEAERQAARERFARHFGVVDLGHATGADNVSIDADLARAYADTHEGG